MGNCSTKFNRAPTREVTLVTLGLDNAGKSTVLSVITNSNQEDVVSTVGYSSTQVRLKKCNVTISDLGGGSRIRGIWSNYYAESHGVIYVVDSSTNERMAECKEELHKVLQDSRIKTKPFLIFANKQDYDNAVDEIGVCNLLDIENTLGDSKECCRVEPCTALYSANNGKKDPAIRRGINWLLVSIREKYNEINEKVIADVALQREAEAQDRRERAERVRIIREERERAEALAAVAAEDNDAGGEQDNDDSDSGIVSTIAQDLENSRVGNIGQVNIPEIVAVKERPPSEDYVDGSTKKASERLTNSDNEHQNQSGSENINKELQNQLVTETSDNVQQQQQEQEPTLEASDPGKQQGSDEPLPQTIAQHKRLAVLKKPRRDSGVCPPSWKTILSPNDPQPSTLNGIPEAYNKDFLGNGHLEGRRPYGVRLQPLPARGNDGTNRRWKVSSLLKRNNRTAPIMEENEDVLSSESKMSVTQNSWVSPEDSMEAFKNTIASVPATRLPLNLFMSPMNGSPMLPGNQQVFLPEDFAKESSDS
ncbi:ADP-ribosylation factor-like protein 13B [Dysidea avara]|uniref:ADP-ribosylation factor-like protein 13B n=1 Tax=Dysidea avara TaxID=196820 RepID=UPI00332B1199